MNCVSVIGNLTKDAEIKYSQSGGAYANFSIAENKRRSGEEETNFFDCVMFGKMVEAIGQYMTKGKKVGIVGELQQRRWEQDGQKRSKVEIIARNVDFLSKPEGSKDDIPF